MDKPDIDQMLFDSERQLRHMQAAHASDVEFMRSNLKAAGDRFADLADLMEADGYTKHINFCRASAERYRRAATV